MLTLKGHFDGTSIVLDEPAVLIVGQAVQVIVDDAPPSPRHERQRIADDAVSARAEHAAGPTRPASVSDLMRELEV